MNKTKRYNSLSRRSKFRLYNDYQLYLKGLLVFDSLLPLKRMTYTKWLSIKGYKLEENL